MVTPRENSMEPQIKQHHISSSRLMMHLWWRYILKTNCTMGRLVSFRLLYLRSYYYLWHCVCVCEWHFLYNQFWLSSFLLADRISFSCLFPASWHFSLSCQVVPRLMFPSLRQLLLIILVLCLIGLLYLMLVSGNRHTVWTSEENHFHR